MIVYHGSNHNFTKLKINSALCRSEATKLNEGYGIYFSLDKKVASKYGKYLYTLNVSRDIVDLRSLGGAGKFVSFLYTDILARTGIMLNNLIDTMKLAHGIQKAKISIDRLPNEIKNLLESDYKTYSLLGDKGIQKVYVQARKSMKNVLKAYMFTYNIPNVGVIKDVSADIVQIVKKERLY